MTIHYRIDVEDVHAHLFRVTLRVPRPTAQQPPKPEEDAAKPSWRDRLKAAKDKLTGD